MDEAASADSDRRRKKHNFSCQRCRGRKQKCDGNRPCGTCVRADTSCVSSERLPRKPHLDLHYTRSLERRIAELEAQVKGQTPETPTLIDSPTPGLGLHYDPSAASEIQTPMIIHASSPNHINLKFASLGQDDKSNEPLIMTRSGDRLQFSEQKERGLIQTYLDRVNPRYPFLHEETFANWYHTWVNSQRDGDALPAEEQWKIFFVKMVFAVSLLVTAQVSLEERRLSNYLYSVALSYLGLIFAKPDPVLHVQAYLMCTIHALHSPSSQTVLTMISTTMRCCVISHLHISTSEPPVQDQSTFLETQIRRRVFWSAYAIDRLISWIYHVPCSLADENIQTELFANISDAEMRAWTPQHPESVPRQTQVSSALHLIRVRRIQSRVLTTIMRAGYDKTLASSYGWRLHVLEELDQWKNQLQPHSDPQSRGYTSQGWVGMAYNYTILLLHRPTKDNVNGTVGERCLQACADTLFTFRQYQKDRQTAQLWPGLLSQFGIGITLLYCFWATPPSYRSDTYRSSKTLTAIRTCSVILAVFAEQWTSAEPLRDVFDALAESVPIHPSLSVDTMDDQGITPEATHFIRPMIPHIMSLVVNKDICRMIIEMISENYPWTDLGYKDRQYAWTSGEVHCPLSCHLCRDRDNSVTEQSEINEPLQGGMGLSVAGESFTVLQDDIFAFPELYGSAEF